MAGRVRVDAPFAQVIAVDNQPLEAVSLTDSISAPVGGLNARDAIAAMPAGDAIVLENFFPNPTQVTLRSGSTNFATGFPNWVQTIMAYGGLSGRKLFAISGGNIYDATSGGAIGAASVSSLTNSTWEYTNFGTPGGNFLFACNAVDAPLRYNGTNWAVINDGTGQTISSITRVTTTATLTTASPHGLITGNSVTVAGATPSQYNGTYTITVTGTTTFTYTMASDPGGSASPVGTYTTDNGITGVTVTKLRNPIAWKNRLWFVEDGSINAWYLPTSSISGAAQKIPLGSITRLGGSLTAIVTCTLDSASNIDDYLGFLTSEGELILYRGSDPAVAGVFNLVGTFRVGRPVSRRCWFKYGADTIFLTQDGYMSLQSAIKAGEDNTSGALSYKIVNAVNGDFQNYNAYTGWQGVLFPLGNKVLINVPEVNMVNAAGATISSITRVGTTATLTTSSNHGLLSGQTVVVANASPSQYNGSYTITVTGNTTFTYTMVSDPGGSASPVGSYTIVSNPTSHQWVMNTITNAWCKFTGWNAACFEVLGDSLYYGGDRVLVKADVGNADNGAAISAICKPAFSYFKNKRQKMFTAVRPVLTCSGSIVPAIQLNVDFDDILPTSISQVIAGSAGGAWNTTPWNGTQWGYAPLTQKQWQTVNGVGFAATCYMQVSAANITLNINSFDFIFQVGGVF